MTSALTAPVIGRLAARFGQSLVLAPTEIAHACSVGVLVLAVAKHCPLWTIALLGIAAGAAGRVVDRDASPIPVCTNLPALVRLPSGVGSPRRPSEHHVAGSAGLIYSILGVTGLIAGFAYGARKWRAAAQRQLAVAPGLLTACSVPMMFAASPWTLAIVLLLPGFGLASSMGKGWWPEADPTTSPASPAG